MVDSARERLTAALETARARPLTTLTVIAGVVIFLLLLGGNAGVAVLVSLLVVPAGILFYLTRLDLYEREPWPLLASVVGAGALVGLLGGLLAAFVFDRFWFSDSRLNLGAIGFTGISAIGEGSVPFGVVLLNGILIPVLTSVAVLGGPIVLRRWPVFRNEITDGMTLGGLAAAGFATVSSFVYFWPSAFDDLPDRPVSQWTALLAGIVVIRPVVLILAGSLLGIAAWQYLSTRDIRAVLVAGVGGIFGWLALPLGSLLLAQSGAVTEFVWYAVVLIVVGVLFRQALSRSLATDGQVLAPADGQQRVVCPNCHRVTPDGSFCSFCRAPLHPEAPKALASHPSDDSSVTEPFDRSPAEPAGAASDPSVPGASDHTPVMARETSDADDPEPRDPVAAPVDEDTEWQRGAESETDLRDDLDDTPPGRASAEPRSGGPEPMPSPVLLPTEDELPGPARLSPPTFDDEPIVTPASTSEASSAPLDRPQGGAELDTHTRTDEPDRPIPLKEWTRRSDSRPDSETDVFGEASESGPPSTPLPPNLSHWRRTVEPGAEPVSGLKWPTNAASSIDRQDDPTRFADVAPADEFEDDPAWDLAARDRRFGEPEHQPVESSSGRWFDASSTLGGATPMSAPETPAESSNDVTPSPDGAGELLASEEPIAVGRTDQPQPGEDDAGPGPGHEQAPPPGLRWYRQDDEDDSTADLEPEPPTDAGEGESDEAGPSESPARTTDPQDTTATEARPGIWRSFIRPGRGGTPRAPQRDQGQPDQE